MFIDGSLVKVKKFSHKMIKSLELKRNWVDAIRLLFYVMSVYVATVNGCCRYYEIQNFILRLPK